MKTAHRRLIQFNRLQLIGAMHADIVIVVTNLHVKKILTSAMRTTILEQNTARGMASKLLEIVLTRKRPNTFACFYEVALEFKLWKVADILEPKNAPHQPKVETLSSSDTSSVDDVDLEERFLKHQEYVRNHEVFIEGHTYAYLAACESVAGIEDGPAWNIGSKVFYLPVWTKVKSGFLQGRNRFSPFSKQDAMQYYIENTSAKAVTMGFQESTHPAADEEIESYHFDSDAKFYYIWDLISGGRKYLVLEPNCNGLFLLNELKKITNHWPYSDLRKCEVTMNSCIVMFKRGKGKNLELDSSHECNIELCKLIQNRIKEWA